MRYRSLTLTTLTLLAVACGGAAPSGPTQTGGPPAAIVVVSGDAQEAAPSAAVASAVSVKVTDATGAAVGGVTVTFRVDSGGGRIAKSSVSTSSAGIASPGAWTLGSSEGRNVLMATVGDLPPLRIRAEAVLGAGSIPGQTIGAGGGTLEITTPGNPYQGLRLTVPAGAYASAGTWNITLATNAPTITLPTGFTAAGPALLMQSTQRRADRLMTLRIPVTRVAGTTPLFIMFDPLRNRMEMVPIVASDASSITVAAAHFNASLIAGPAAPGSLRGNGSLIGIEGYGIPVNATLDALGFSPADLEAAAASIWPVAETGSYAFPQGHGPAIPVMGILGTIQNQPFASVIKTTPTLGTLADTAALAGLVIMAKRHFNGTAPVSNVLSDIAALYASMSPTNRDEMTSLNLRGMLLTARLPQLVLFSERLSDVPTSRVGRSMFASVLRVTPSTLWFTAPADPSAPGQLTLGSSGFLSRAFKQTADGQSASAEAVLPVGGSFLFPLELYADVPGMVTNALNSVGNVRQTLNNQMAALAGFPTVTLEVQGTTGAGWAADDSPLVIRDTTAKVRAVCTNCTSAIPQYSEPTQQTVATSRGPCTGGALSIIGAGCGGSAIFDGLGLGNLSGAVLSTVNSADLVGQLQSAFRPLIPLNTPLLQRILKIQPATQTLATGVLGTFSAPVLDPPAKGFGMEWDWGDGTAKTLNQNVSTATHSYATSGTYTVTVTLKRSNTAILPGLTLAVAKAVVTVGVPVWKFTSMTVVTSRNPGTPIGPVDPFRADSQHYTRMRDGLSEGGIYVIERDTTRDCTSCGQRTLTRGLFLVEGVSLTLSTLSAPPVVAVLNQVINFSLLPAPGVKGWPVAGTAKLSVQPCTRDGDPGEFWTQTGDLVTGRVTGKTVHRCQGGYDDPNALLPMYATQIMSVDVTFAGDVATGTITGNYIGVNFSSLDRAQLVVTFQARRVSQ